MTDRPAQSAPRCRECGHLVRVHAAAGHCLADECECQMVDDPAPPAPPERPGETVRDVMISIVRKLHGALVPRDTDDIVRAILDDSRMSVTLRTTQPADVATERPGEVWTSVERTASATDNWPEWKKRAAGIGGPTLPGPFKLKGPCAAYGAHVGGQCTCDEPLPAEQPAPTCRCGSGAHPRRCQVHPERYKAHCNEISVESLEDEVAALEAKVAAAEKAYDMSYKGWGNTIESMARLETKAEGLADKLAAAERERDEARKDAEDWRTVSEMRKRDDQVCGRLADRAKEALAGHDAFVAKTTDEAVAKERARCLAWAKHDVSTWHAKVAAIRDGKPAPKA